MLLQPREPSHQLATIRPLATSLYDSTRRSSVLSETRNELSLLVTLLGATEKSALSLDSSHPALPRILQKCHLVLLDLQKLQTLPSGSGLIPDVRARFSSLIFELSALNADMSMYFLLIISDCMWISCILTVSQILAKSCRPLDAGFHRRDPRGEARHKPRLDGSR